MLPGKHTSLRYLLIYVIDVQREVRLYDVRLLLHLLLLGHGGERIASVWACGGEQRQQEEQLLRGVGPPGATRRRRRWPARRSRKLLFCPVRKQEEHDS